MAINNLITLFCAGIIAGLYSCECVSGPNHTFEHKVKIFPEQLEYKVGDTIWLSSSFSCKGLLNTSTGETEDFCGIKEDVSMAINIMLLEPLPQDTLAATPAIDFFDFVNQHGYTTKANSRSVTSFFQLDEDQYSLKVGIVPRKSGKFALFVYGGGPYTLPHAKKCDTGSISFTPDVQDNHISLLADFKNGIENVADIDKSQVYCFEVK